MLSVGVLVLSSSSSQQITSLGKDMHSYECLLVTT